MQFGGFRDIGMNAIEVILVELVGLQHQANGKGGVDDVLVVITCVVPSFWGG